MATPIGLYLLPRAGEHVFRPQEAPAGYLDAVRAALVLRPGTMLANIQDLVGLPAALAAQSPRYGTIAAPTVIVAGDADPVVLTEQQARPLAKAIPGAKLVVLSGHRPHGPGRGRRRARGGGRRLADRIAAAGNRPCRSRPAR